MRLTLQELLNHNIAYEDKDARYVMTVEELIEWFGIANLAPVFDALMAHQDYREDGFVYSLTDDPVTPPLK